jgi:transcriptional regulator with XRE-family HTH domain
MTMLNSADITARLARNVRRVRDEHGWTCDELGTLIGVADNAITMWERGTRRIGERHLLELAALVELDISWFYLDHDAQ